MALLNRLGRRILGKPNKTAQWVPGPLTYNQDGLATRHNCDFMREPRFAHAYAAGEGTGSWGADRVHWRVHVACWAAHLVRDLEGDFVECGVNRGGLARAVIEYVDFPSLAKSFYLLDTFEGLIGDQISDVERAAGIRPGGYEECFNDVVRTFSPFPRVKIVRGAVPSTLNQVISEKVCYLSIDMNCAEPEIAALRFFWGKLVKGAAIVLDDYGWRRHAQQKEAHDVLARELGYEVLTLPTGQGLIIK